MKNGLGFALGGQHDDRDVPCIRRLSQLAQGLIPIPAGHHHIEENKVRFLLLGSFQPLDAVRRADYVIAVGLEAHLDHINEIRLIINYQDFLAHMLSYFSCSSCAPDSLELLTGVVILLISVMVSCARSRRSSAF